MKKIRFFTISMVFILLLTLFGTPLCLAESSSSYELPKDTKVYAQSAILVSLGATQKEDVVLFERSADAVRAPAAMVRIAVGMLAVKMIREKNLDMDTVTGTYTQQCLEQITGSGLATVGMSIGETWTLRDLLYMSMIETAADAVITLAITLCGSQTEFVNQMNQLVSSPEVGCANTQFSNVHGLDAANHRTTARDMYRILRYAMDYPEMETMLSTVSYTVNPIKGGAKRTYSNVNAMLRSSTGSYYAAMAFGRTGYTTDAGRCMASVARDSGYEYLAVVMGCPNEMPGESSVAVGTSHYLDSQTLFRWAFRNFSYKTLLSKNDPVHRLPVELAWDTDFVMLVPSKDFATIVYDQLSEDTIIKRKVDIPESVKAPIQKGQVIGKVEIIINLDQKIGEVELVASESIEQSKVLAIWDNIQSFLKSPWFYLAIALLVILLVGYIIMNVMHNRKRRRNRMKRVKKYK